MLRRPRPFLILAGASVLGFVVFALLHNLFYAIGVAIGQVPVATPALEALHVVAFLIAIFACPAGVIAGLIGALVALLRRRPDGA